MNLHKVFANKVSDIDGNEMTQLPDNHLCELLF